MKKLDDLSLVTRVAVFHDSRSFDRLVVKYQSPVRKFFLSQTLGNQPLSDDLAQETFLKVYLNIRKFRGISHFSTWLYRIAYNVWYDYLRRHKQTSDLDAPQVRGRIGEGSDRNLSMDLYNALQILSEKERLCITLQLIEGQPIEKIAEISGLNSNTVKSHLLRGKEKLANYLRKNGYDRKG
ncbi:RNA polymerase sigma factor [Prevotella cerevisiae]|uniref:RNA polymerase sigma factor n=1 Tax=Segatella cerevisiae TaxID=2053716 RepID=A0ABT1BZ02_9BACT|nr:RNA polymerase sigma factor [Segatella cerevisiae]MCO6026050.1 RNA polymerase sigma factor [Segatella cerevisiae]